MKGDWLKEIQFPAVDYEGWQALARKAIGESDVEAALSSHTEDGIVLRPLYSRVRDAVPLSRARPTPGWRVLQRLDDPDPARANAQAQEDLANGASGLAIVFEGAPNAFGHGLPASAEALDRALEGVQLNRLHLRIDVHPASRSSVDWIVELAKSRRVDPSRVSLSLGIDPAATFAGTGRLRMSIEALEASMPQSLAHFFGMDVPAVLLEADGRVFHNGGATEAQELGAMLAAAVGHLRMFQEARQPLLYAMPHIGFALAVDQDQLLSMAKIRALRRLWSRIQESCGVKPVPADIHAETSWRMLSAKDHESNILRNTIAAFAAATGGADSLCVIPHTAPLGLPGPFARRLARNTQRILADEAHLGFVEDPASGSGGLEALTKGLCEAAWAEFQQIEKEGGLLKSLAAGHIQKRIETARARRLEEYRQGRRVIVGNTLYPPDQERPADVLPVERRALPEDGTVFCQRLDLARIDEQLAGAEP
jgi:methylmalonyl-CoA mutase